MHIDTAGTYTLQYTATDSCGNETIEERTVEVVALKITLFTDGTFIINEKSTDRDANIALHGAVTNEYDPLDSVHPYRFANASQRPWHDQRTQIVRVECGSAINTSQLAYWFSGCTEATAVDLSLIAATSSLNNTFRDCRKLESIVFPDDGFTLTDRIPLTQTFYNCYVLGSVDASKLKADNLTSITDTFYGCYALEDVDFSGVTSGSLTEVHAPFGDCTSLKNVVLSPNFKCSLVTDFYGVFVGCSALEVVDISMITLEASSVSTQSVFSGCGMLHTIYASEQFKSSSTTLSGQNMFANCPNLVGGAGTVWRSTRTNGTYARIDNLPDAPGYFTAKP